MFIGPYFAGFLTPKGMGTFLVFLVAFVVPYVLALKQLRALAQLKSRA